MGRTAPERVVCGVMHQPYVGESFLAVAGEAAHWRRGNVTRALATRRCPDIANAIVACTTPDMFSTARTREGFDRVRAAAKLTRFGGDWYAYCLLAMGLIDVVVVSELSKLAFLRAFPRVFKGSHLSHPAVRSLQGRTLRVESSGKGSAGCAGTNASSTAMFLLPVPAKPTVCQLSSIR